MSEIDKWEDAEKHGNIVYVKNQEKKRIEFYLTIDKEPTELEALNLKMSNIWQQFCDDYENYAVHWDIYCVKHNKKVIRDVNRGLYCPKCRKEE